MQSNMALFVYGSLTEGMVHFSKINSYILERSPAVVYGQVYRLPSGFPVFLAPDERNYQDLDRVSGEIVLLSAPQVLIAILDEFHGVSKLVPEKSLYNRMPIKAETTFGEQEVEVYAMNRAKLPKEARRIPLGDWVTDFKEHPSITSLLTDKQSTYIKRLCGSSGREIVPIDLDLYRELMKLELIVDKGRRLALSKLGKEVARFLPE